LDPRHQCYTFFMELSLSDQLRLRRAATEILAILDTLNPPAPPDDANRWLSEHLVPAPGHRVDIAILAKASGVTSRTLGRRLDAPRYKSNGRTYLLGIRLID